MANTDIGEERYGNDWRINKTLAERQAYMLEHSIATDVTFLVSNKAICPDAKQEKFSAHKHMLISASPVFFAHFSGKFRPETTIEVHDIEPAAFYQMLRYVYTDHAEITGNHVMQIMHTSKKYQISGLTQMCVKFLQNELRPENACLIYEQSEFFCEEGLSKKSMTLIRENTKGAFSSQSFLDISHQTLEKILESDALSITELEICDNCIMWAEEKLKEQKKTASGQAIRDVLGSVLYKIRMPTLPIAYFCTTISNSGILKENEELQLLRYIGTPTKPPDADFLFPTTTRTLVQSDEMFLSQDCLQSAKMQVVTRDKLKSKLTLISQDKLAIDSLLLAVPLPTEKDQVLGNMSYYVDYISGLFMKRKTHEVNSRTVKYREEISGRVAYTVFDIPDIDESNHNELSIVLTGDVCEKQTYKISTKNYSLQGCGKTVSVTYSDEKKWGQQVQNFPVNNVQNVYYPLQLLGIKLCKK